MLHGTCSGCNYIAWNDRAAESCGSAAVSSCALEESRECAVGLPHTRPRESGLIDRHPGAAKRIGEETSNTSKETACNTNACPTYLRLSGDHRIFLR